MNVLGTLGAVAPVLASVIIVVDARLRARRDGGRAAGDE